MRRCADAPLSRARVPFSPSRGAHEVGLSPQRRSGAGVRRSCSAEARAGMIATMNAAQIAASMDLVP